MSAQTDIAELHKARQAATCKVKTAKRKKDGTISSKTSDAQMTTLQLLKAEVDAGYCHPVARPTPADHRAAADSYEETDALLTQLREEHSVWKRALCAAAHKMPGAFSAAFCQRKIKQIGEALHRAANSALLRDIKF